MPDWKGRTKDKTSKGKGRGRRFWHCRYLIAKNLNFDSQLKYLD
jgi:hypothetical protein